MDGPSSAKLVVAGIGALLILAFVLWVMLRDRLIKRSKRSKTSGYEGPGGSERQWGDGGGDGGGGGTD